MRKFKKTLSVMLAATMAFSAFSALPFTVSAAEVDEITEVSEEEQLKYDVFSGLYYIVLENGTAEIVNHSAIDIKLTIPSEVNGYDVTSIGDSAFSDCADLTYVTIPNSVTNIKYGAFQYCENLTDIIIPDSVTSIGACAFNGCRNLTSITISENVTSIGWLTFANCSSLTSVTIPSSVTSIEDSAFAYCDSLTSVTISDGVTSIGEHAFSDCSALKTIEFPDSITEIGNEPFFNTAWYNNHPDGVVYVGKIAYEYKGEMPENTTITIKPGTKSIYNLAFTMEQNLTSIIIPDSVTSIGNYTFANCSSLETIEIPDSVTEIGDDAFYNTAWYNNHPDGVVYVGKIAYVYKGEMPENTTITIEPGTKSIYRDAFYKCSNLTEVTIPNSVTNIGATAFENCNNLKSVIIPFSVTDIGYNAFGYYSYYEYNEQFDYGITITKKVDGFTIYGYAGTAAERYANENEIEFVKIGNAVIGDVNGDGVLSVADATLIQKHSASIIKFTNEQLALADFNGDGTVNVNDATVIQRELVKS